MNRLTEHEALDAASIVRAYARKIREDLDAIDREVASSGRYSPTPQHMRAALLDAAASRDRLADKLEALAP